ncbi:glycine--tRNA ligase subunit beta [Aestuariibacter sp. AA17]|uniref:Glycine--tRNA ligase beta subunit n=1 Tax=Fluctibacter corallii TaxID=2984329 RepID=A0ABT3AD01_9ALTE|nr:glycine--tRNA ligase subunit beta [Aestuariibacter sp. AA17]MCV2886549.1 glycine--tRNA ligase subunit beta [Aestuariibacter sp. AA17]
MRKESLLIELGTEELPPKALKSLAIAFKDGIQDGLHDAELSFEDLTWYASPRRLAVKVTQLVSRQEDKVVEKRGPAIAAAFDDSGNPTKAAEGWARSNGITVADAERLTTDKGEWLLFKANVEGQPIESLLPDIVATALKKLPIPKPMRWGAKTTQFIRPAHTFTMMYGNEIISGSVLDINSAATIRGHRFHGDGEFTLTHADDYLQSLESQFVIADYAARKQQIIEQLAKAAEAEGGVVETDNELLEEVTSLVEWPVVLTASFDEDFLEVPKEALIYTMKDDQKYFPLLSKDGELMPRFLFVSNIDSKDKSQVISGNEKVIRPRLADARFFFETDRKETLESRLSSLETVLFQKQLGTLKDKSDRISALAGQIAELMGTNTAEAKRAGLLCKTDLMTNMVMEFPDVQGVMGMHYARHDGEPEAVATALDEQYKPRFAGDSLPSAGTSSAVALADKLDTLVGIFGIGQLPKGDKDPFALRRAAIGVLRIIVENKLELDLLDLVSRSATLFGGKLTNQDTSDQVVDFILARFRPFYQEKGIDVDVIQAVEAKRPTKPADFAARIEGVSSFKSMESASALAAANKRVANILQKNGISEAGKIDTALFEQDEERQLFSALEDVEKTVRPMLDAGNYEEALKAMSCLRDSIDAFFDNVMVMANDDAIKKNRLALLFTLRRLFLHTADISLLN